MNVTDEMVERAKAALVSAKDDINEGRMESSLPHPEIILWPSEYEFLAEVALTAALGDVEPSDDLQDWINGLAEQLAEARNERDAAIAALGDVEPLEDVHIDGLARSLCDDLHMDRVWDRVPEDPHDADYPQGRELYRWLVRNTIANYEAIRVANAQGDKS